MGYETLSLPNHERNLAIAKNVFVLNNIHIRTNTVEPINQ